MANPYFKFKRFTVWHDKCAMKVGTDSVLLGAWVRVEGCKNILDVGTGTGLIALMMAQRSTARIDAVDIDKDACLQAAENVMASPFASFIHVHHHSFNDYIKTAEGRYDLIVSNPPFFADSLKCPDNQRNTARHTDTLPLEECIAGCLCLLTSDGRIALILPTDREDELIRIAKEKQLYILRKTDIIPTPNALPKRILVELSPCQLYTFSSTILTIETSRHHYTPEYKSLTREYYLNM